MRLVRVSVEAFRAIERGAVDFAPGLNVLYGPNDHGKSTLASAIRAALLVLPASAEGAGYSSWYGGDNPRVELTFADAEGYYWRVRKTFGSSGTAAAELLHSKDGRNFSSDCKGRQVEEKLRALLRWGIPAPGGKGAPRGAPHSFLASALLGPQDGAEAILQHGIAEDPDESGKLRLTQVLAALAQDPLFKRVLATAQAEVDQYYTETGRRRTDSRSRFREAAERVRELRAELEDRNRDLLASAQIEQEAGALRERHAQTLVAFDEARVDFAQAQRRLAEARARRALEERLATAKAELGRIDGQIEAERAAARALADAEEAQRTRASAVAAADTALTAAQGQARAAEEALRAASSEDAARALELQRAQIEKRLAELATQQANATARKTALGAALAARTQAQRAAGEATAATKLLEQSRQAEAKAAAEAQRQASDVEKARIALAFVRWRTAVEALEGFSQAGTAARDAQAQAQAKEAEAVTIEAAAQDADAKLQVRAGLLPAAAQHQALQRLERERDKADAALGGGLSVTMRPARKLNLRVQADAAPAQDAQVGAARSFDAERRLQVTIEGVGGFDISAGRAEQRATAERLRSRWRDEAEPVLERAGAKSMRGLEELCTALGQEQATLAELRRAAGALRAEAKHLREQARIHESRSGAVPFTHEQVAARKAAIGDVDLTVLEVRYRPPATSAETQAEALHERLQKQQQLLAANALAAGVAVREATFRLEQVRERARDLDAAWTAQAAAFAGADPQAQLTEVEAQLAQQACDTAAARAQLEALATRAGSGQHQAQRGLEAAQAALQQAQAARDVAAAELQQARDESAARGGTLNERRTRIATLDRTVAQAAVAALRSELDAHPAGGATEADVAQAQQRLDAAAEAHEHASAELHQKEGSLAYVGGAALREELQQLEEAHLAAQARERELEIEADAWRLLRDTLREVENEEGAHLGRALAQPVGERFAQLTGGRYGGLRLDASMRAEGLGATASSVEGPDVLQALSVGTRAQLAALIRLSIADQLRSAVVLDDHLVHTDGQRLEWFEQTLLGVAVNAQVVVITCRPQDYLPPGLLAADAEACVDLAAGTVRVVDLGRALQRYGPRE